MLVALGTIGCSDGGGEVVPETLLEPPPEGQGVQYALQTSIAAGVETEHCKFVVAPPEGGAELARSWRGGLAGEGLSH